MTTTSTRATTGQRRAGRRLRIIRSVIVTTVALAAIASACTQDIETTSGDDTGTNGDSGVVTSVVDAAGMNGGTSGAIASDRVPDGYKACDDRYTGQSYHLCVWVLNATYGFTPRSASEIAAGSQPSATAGTTLRIESVDQPWGNRDVGPGGPEDQAPNRTVYWTFGCRSTCGPEVTINYRTNAPYEDNFSLWANVEAGPGDDGWDCRWGRYTACAGRSMHSDEGDYSVGATYTNRPYLVQIDSAVRGTLTRTTYTTGNLMAIDSGSDPLTPPDKIEVADRTQKSVWMGGFMEPGKNSNFAMSYRLTGNGGLDGSTIRMNAAFDPNGNPVPTRYDATGKVVAGDPTTTWCEVIKVGTANLSCRVNSVAGNPDIVSFTLVP